MVVSHWCKSISCSLQLSQSGICGNQRPQKWTKGGSYSRCPLSSFPNCPAFSLTPNPRPLLMPIINKTKITDKRKSRLVLQTQEALWRKLNNLTPLSRRNEELYVSKEAKEKAFASEGKSCRPETITAENHHACHDLSVWNKQQKSLLLSG